MGVRSIRRLLALFVVVGLSVLCVERDAVQAQLYPAGNALNWTCPTGDIQDLGLGQVYSASDTLCCRYAFSADKINDGYYDGSSCDCHGWHSNGYGSHWLQMVFPSNEVMITYYRITSRQGGYQAYPSSSTQLLVSMDGVNYTQIDSFGSTYPWITRTISPPYNSTYRYIRWNLYSGSYVDISEVELYGCIQEFDIPEGTYGVLGAALYKGCEPGYFCTHARKTPCPSTSYQSSSNQTSCDLVPSGYYGSPVGAATTTIGCEVGFFCKNGVRTQCPDGSYQNQTLQSSCLPVPPGYYANAVSSGYLACPVGYQCANGTKVPCDSTSFSSVPASLTCDSIVPGYYGFPVGAANQKRACEVGNYCINGVMQACAVGTFQNETTKSFCYNVTEGYYSPTTRNTQLPCPVGSYCNGSDPVACPAGLFQDKQGSSTCRDTQTGYYAVNGSFEVGCEVGYYCMSGLRVACNASTFQNSSMATACLAVPNGFYKLNGSAISSCSVGNYCIAGVQNFCPAGGYTNTTGRSTCDPMPTGTYGIPSEEAANTIGQGSIGYLDCPPGSYCLNGLRILCPVNTFQNASGRTSCLPIPDGQYAFGSGLNSTNPCDPGYACVNNTRQACSQAQYQPSPGQAACLPVPAGQLANGTINGTMIGGTGTKLCPIGSQCENGTSMLCPLGTVAPVPGMSKCSSCNVSAGQYQDELGKSVCKILTVCDATSYISILATPSSDRSCAVTSVCDYQTSYDKVLSTATSDRVCANLTRCVAGQFQTSFPSTSSDRVCTGCPKGFVDDDYDPYTTPCVNCEAGYYFVNASQSGDCLPHICPAGTSDIDSNSTTPCALCDNGYYTAAGSFGSCSKYICSAGTIDHDSNPSTPCLQCQSTIGLYVPLGSFGPCEAFPCQSGTADDDQNAATACASCPAGTYAPQGSIACTACPAGFTDDDNRPDTACVACGNGTYAPRGSRGPCANLTCKAGTYDGDFNSSTPCVLCNPGQYSSGYLSPCENCNLTSVDDDSDPATPCLECGPGVTLLSEGLVGSCDSFKCPAGTTDDDNITSTECVRCNAGSYAPPGSSTPCNLMLCAAGTTDFDSNSSTPCVACPSGSYAGKGFFGACNSCAVGYVDHDSDPSTPCQSCMGTPGLFVPAGSFGSCPDFPCDKGSADSDQNPATPCEPCSVGSFSTGVSCEVCKAPSVDHDSSPATPCVTCTAGSYVSKSALNGSCSYYLCPAGTVDHDYNPLTPCIACKSGEYSSRNTSGPCLPCEAGFTDDDANPATLCLECLPGTYVPPGANQTCSSLRCPLGQVDDDSKPITPCVSCTEGVNYASKLGLTFCSPVSTCDATMWVKYPPTVSSNRVCSSAILYCDEQDSKGAKFCSKCLDGYYLSKGVTEDTCSPCPPGSYCLNNIMANCTVGTYSLLEGSSFCSSCSPGSYQPRSGASTPCLLCDPSTYTPLSASSVCSPISNGFYGTNPVNSTGGFSSIEICPSGAMCTNGSLTLCPPGTYQPANKSSNCLSCGLNKYSNSTGRTTACSSISSGFYGVGGSPFTFVAKLPCSSGHYCVNSTQIPCEIGTYQDSEGKSSCIDCGFGTYKSQNGSSSPCDAIPDGYCPTSAFSSGSRVGAIQSCPIGFFCLSGVKVQCAFGSYQDELGKTSCKACSISCVKGLTSTGDCDPTNGESTCEDVTPPTITLKLGKDITVEAGKTFKDPGYTASDTYDTSLKVTVSPSSPSFPKVGVFTIKYSTSDAAGNSFSISRTVRAVDTTPPVITVLGQANARIIQEGKYEDAGATASDLVDPVSVLAITRSGWDMSTKNVGTFKITYSCSDLSSNTGSAFRQVTVVDRKIELAALAKGNDAYLKSMKSDPESKPSAESSAIAAYIAAGGSLSNDTVISSAESSYQASLKSGSSSTLPIIIGAVVGGLVLIVVLVLFIKWRQSKNSVPRHSMEPLGRNSTTAIFQNPLFPASSSSVSRDDGNYSEPGFYETPTLGGDQTYVSSVNTIRNPNTMRGKTLNLHQNHYEGSETVPPADYAEPDQFRTRSFLMSSNPVYTTTDLSPNPVYVTSEHHLADPSTNEYEMPNVPGHGGKHDYVDPMRPTSDGYDHVNQDHGYETPGAGDNTTLKFKGKTLVTDYSDLKNNHSKYASPTMMGTLSPSSGDYVALDDDHSKYKSMPTRPPQGNLSQAPENQYEYSDEHRIVPTAPPRYEMNSLRRPGPSTKKIFTEEQTDFGFGRETSLDNEDEELDQALKRVHELKHIWFQPQLGRTQSEALLKDWEVGEFIVRESSTQKGAFGISLKKSDLTSEIFNGLIVPGGKGYKMVKANVSLSFPSMEELLAYYYVHFIPSDIPVQLVFRSRW